MIAPVRLLGRAVRQREQQAVPGRPSPQAQVALVVSPEQPTA
jgi:hypothetical protein